MSATASAAERLDAETLAGADLDAWRALAELRENPFLTPEWYRSWLATHPGEAAFLIGWRVEGRLRGVLPLVRASRGPFGLLRFAGARRGDWFSPACRREDERAMAAACSQLLLRNRRAWQLIRFDRLDDQGEWPQALWAAGGGIAPSGPRRVDVLPYIDFREDGYDAYLAGRSRNFRSQLGRRRRKLEREHELSFRMTSDPAALEGDLETFFHLHEERWLRRGGSSALSGDAKEMQRQFAAAALERGWLRLWIAEADGRPAAAWYGWRVGRRYLYSLSGLAERYEQHGLGTVLLAHTIEQAAAEGARTYDLMWGDEDYKRRFETGRRRTQSWVVARRRHPVRVGSRIADRLLAEARRLPPRLTGPIKRAARAVGRS